MCSELNSMRAMPRNLRLKFSTVKKKIFSSCSSTYSPGLPRDVGSAFGAHVIFIHMNHISWKVDLTKSLHLISKNVSLNKVVILLSVSFCQNLTMFLHWGEYLKKYIWFDINLLYYVLVHFDLYLSHPNMCMKTYSGIVKDLWTNAQIRPIL